MSSQGCVRRTRRGVTTHSLCPLYGVGLLHGSELNCKYKSLLFFSFSWRVLFFPLLCFISVEESDMEIVGNVVGVG